MPARVTIVQGHPDPGGKHLCSGWPDPKCMKLVEDLTTLVRDHLTEGLTIYLERERYLNEYRAPPVPKKMTLDSQYGVCFRACMRQVLEILWRAGKRHRLDVVIEDGHNNTFLRWLPKRDTRDTLTRAIGLRPTGVKIPYQ